MIFQKTPIDGAYIIDLEEKQDERGFFARAFCVNEFSDHGLENNFVQANLSMNYKKGTIRGLHYQLPPKQEAKLYRCIKGKIFNVFVDMRANSPTYLKWFGIELSSVNRKMLLVPKGCATGYQALEDDTEVLYWSSTVYAPELERGVRYSDPVINIFWPISKDIIVSDKDKNLPDVKRKIK